MLDSIIALRNGLILPVRAPISSSVVIVLSTSLATTAPHRLCYRMNTVVSLEHNGMVLETVCLCMFSFVWKFCVG